MTFASAIASLRKDGDAVRPTTWRGFLYRADTETVDEYDPAKSSPGYSVGNKVTYGGSVYICTSATGPTPGPFDSSKWTRSERNFDICFLEANDTDNDQAGGPGSTSERTDDNPYRAHVTVGAAGRDYGTAIIRTAGTGSSAKPLQMDGQMLAAFMSDDWVAGTYGSFIPAVDGTNRW